MENITQHISNQPALAALFVISLILVLFAIPYFVKQQKRYGSAFEFASGSRKVISGIAAVSLISLTIYGLTPYVPPPTDEIAIVLGNTQNTPNPKISEEIAEAIEGTMLQHKGEDAEEIIDSIRIISATKNPTVINLDASELKLREIGKNSSNAKRSAKLNLKAIEGAINTLPPADNGANYMEAILEAKDNVREGAKIIVIGSGLSDNGDLNFSKSNLLIKEEMRTEAIQKIEDKYGRDYLESYEIIFYGLGDTMPPQEPLTNKQKVIVRNIYKDTIRGLGGEVDIHTKALVGNPVSTDYIVGTTDTGCGNIGLIFDDDNLKFVGNQATFTDDSAAKLSLTTTKEMWDKYSDIIQSIQIDGYIAHYPGPDLLSQQRAELVKKVLVNLGIPAAKITATGKGFGPYEKDSQNRIVKVTISRNSDQCEK